MSCTAFFCVLFRHASRGLNWERNHLWKEHTAASSILPLALCSPNSSGSMLILSPSSRPKVAQSVLQFEVCGPSTASKPPFRHRAIPNQAAWTRQGLSLDITHLAHLKGPIRNTRNQDRCTARKGHWCPCKQCKMRGIKPLREVKSCDKSFVQLKSGPKRVHHPEAFPLPQHATETKQYLQQQQQQMRSNNSRRKTRIRVPQKASIELPGGREPW